MYRLLPIIFLGVLSVSYAGPNVTNLSVEGSLKSDAPLGCVALSRVDNRVAPPDMFAGVASCLEKDEFENAGLLIYMARLYGIFDAKRVADRTAGQGITVLQMNTFAGAGNDSVVKFQEYVNAPDTKAGILASVCERAKSIGYPAYHPEYMIRHGIKAFTGIVGDGLDAGFDASRTWQAMLKKYCRTTGVE